MKRTFFILVTLVMMSANVFADGLTATLQQGDKMTPFYGVDAFKNAYAAADSGAVITLSAGTFNIVNSIEKPMKIVGNFGLDESSVERTILSSLSIAANKVTIDGIYFSGSVTLGNISDCKISHSWIQGALQYASIESWHTNTVVDQCVIKTETAIRQGKNYTIKNSTINKFLELNTSSNVAYISNCVIWNFCYNHTNIPYNAGRIPTTSDRIPYAIYKNNILIVDITSYTYKSSSVISNNYYSYLLSSPKEFYNNYFAVTCYNSYGGIYSSPQFFSDCISFAAGCINESNSIQKIALSTKYPANGLSLGNGQDGTPLGITGGSGFSLYPNIPRITSSTIDSNTDNDGKLNVTIKVSVPQ